MGQELSNDIGQTPGDLAADWIATLDAAGRTREAYRRNIGYYLAWLEATGRTGGDRADVVAYKAELSDRYAASTVSAYLAPVRLFYRYLSDTYGVRNLGAGVRGAKRPKGFRKDPLSVDQVRAVLDGIGGATVRDLRDRAIVSLMVRTGLRDVEVSRADVGDVRNVSGRTVLFIQGKGRDDKGEFVVLGGAVLGDLARYRQAVGSPAEGPLFASLSDRNSGERLTTRSVSRIVKERLAAAGIDSERVTAHSLRHTAVTLALMGGAPIQDVQAMARHASIQTTMIYAHNVQRITSPAEDRISALIDTGTLPHTTTIQRRRDIPPSST